MTWRIEAGDARAVLAGWPAGSVQCVCTSVPYYNLRSYSTDPQIWGGDPACDHRWEARTRRLMDSGGAGVAGSTLQGGKGTQVACRAQVSEATCAACGAWRGELGSEPTVEQYVANLVQVFRAVRRVLRPDGTLWLNIGDSYSNAGRAGSRGRKRGAGKPGWTAGGALGDKQLLLIPARVALALQADGWVLRSDIIWAKPNCLSGGAIVYARTQKGEMPMMVKDLVRLRPETVQLWNGQRWTQVVSWLENPRPDRPLELTLRNGQRISCTPDHLWPTQRGNVRADALVCGDIIQTCQLPEPPEPERPEMLPADDIGWFVGLYLAEGSRSGECIQIAGHRDETARWERVQRLVARYGGSCKRYEHGQAGADFHIFSKVLSAVLEMYIAGHIAQDKHLSVACWRRDNAFLREVLDGYLNGDGHWDAANARWRIGFTRNYNLEADLRTLCARLGYSLRLNLSTAKIGERVYPTFKGELREARPNHHNTKQDGEVVSIAASKARKFWDISVADDPHLFALASGILTHNCMPESVTDRPTKSYEHVFLFSQQARYYYDADALREPHDPQWAQRRLTTTGNKGGIDRAWSGAPQKGIHEEPRVFGHPDGRNARDVWTIATEPYAGAHFAVMPERLAEACILAGTSQAGQCNACGAPWRRMLVAAETVQVGARRKHADATLDQHGATSAFVTGEYKQYRTAGWAPTCRCDAGAPVPQVVADPFTGAGTVGVVALRHGRGFWGAELNPDYVTMAEQRIVADAPLFNRQEGAA